MTNEERSVDGTYDDLTGCDARVSRRSFLSASSVVGVSLIGTTAATAAPTSTDGGYGTTAYGDYGYGGIETTS